MTLQERVNGNVDADFNAGLDIDTELHDVVGFPQRDVVGEAERHDAVGVEAPEPIVHLVDRHRVPIHAQIARSGKACRSTADDRNLLAGWRAGRKELFAAALQRIDRIALQIADADRRVVLRIHARTFAKLARRANPRATCTHRVRASKCRAHFP